MALTPRFFRGFSGKSPLRAAFAAAAAGSLALNISSKVLNLLVSILLARWLGANEYGSYASAIAVMLLLGVVARLGLPTLMIRLLPTYEVSRQWGLMRGLLRETHLVVASFSLLLAGIGAFVVWRLGGQLTPTHAQAFWWAMAILPVAVLTSLHSAMLRGLHHVLAGQLPESLVIPGLLAAVIAIWQFSGVHELLDLTADMAVALRLAVTVAAFAVGAILLIQRMPTELLTAVPEYDRVRWVRSAAPLLVLAGMSIITTQTDVLMLAAIQDVESAGVYQAAVRGGELVAFSLFVISVVIQPTISRLYALGELQQLQRVIAAAARAALMLALPVALVLALFSKPLLSTIYGQEFERGAIALAMLCAAQVVNVGAGLVGQILIMTGHERDAATGAGMAAALNILLNAILIPLWGMEGAALATGISLVAWSVFLTIRVRSRTDLSGSFFRNSG
jgi:O-antigen/teichoic acid export membrane protein